MTPPGADVTITCKVSQANNEPSVNVCAWADENTASS